MRSAIKYTKEFATSKDGTRIGYRKFGKGVGIILVHGGMMASQNLMKLGELLADNFTVYIPDRRGRGQSEANDNLGLTAESEDLQALVNKTKAEFIYGLSSGAIVVIQTAIIEKTIRKIVLHEPPILSDEKKEIAWVGKYREATNKENYGKAFLSAAKGTGDPSSLLNILPDFIISPLLNLAIKSEAKKVSKNNDDITLKELLTAMRYDIKVVEDSEGIIEKSKNITTDILLLRGQKSQPYLRNTIDKLSTAFPNAKLVDFAGQGHTVSDNGGKPELVATELRRFFLNN